MPDTRTTMQIRSGSTTFHTRADETGKYIEGYFIVFNTFYDYAPGCRETVAPSALDGQLDSDVRALINHVHHLVLGRTIPGTLQLRVDEKGLYGIIKINEDDVDAMNLYARVQRGDVNQCSFGFDIISETREVQEDGTVVYIITAIKLYEVSVVTFPAYEETSVSARSMDDIKNIRLEKWRNDMKRRLNHAR